MNVCQTCGKVVTRERPCEQHPVVTRRRWTLKELIGLALLIGAAIALVWLYDNPLPAGASTVSRYEMYLHTLTPAPNTDGFQAFGNLKVGDCSYASVANLIQHNWPTAAITTTEVVSAWRANGSMSPDSSYAWSFMATTGFAGHTISAVTLITTESEVMTAVHTGGVWAQVWVTTPEYPAADQAADGADHDVAVVGANTRGPIVVWWGVAKQMTWAQWNKIVYQEFAVTWNAS